MITGSAYSDIADVLRAYEHGILCVCCGQPLKVPQQLVITGGLLCLDCAMHWRPSICLTCGQSNTGTCRGTCLACAGNGVVSQVSYDLRCDDPECTEDCGDCLWRADGMGWWTVRRSVCDVCGKTDVPLTESRYVPPVRLNFDVLPARLCDTCYAAHQPWYLRLLVWARRWWR